MEPGDVHDESSTLVPVDSALVLEDQLEELCAYLIVLDSLCRQRKVGNSQLDELLASSLTRVIRSYIDAELRWAKRSDKAARRSAARSKIFSHRLRPLVASVSASLGYKDERGWLSGKDTAVKKSRVRQVVLSFARIVVRNPDAYGMILEILAEHDRELLLWGNSRSGRAWVHACAAWALCWHLGVFKVLSSVLKLVERIFTRRA